MCFRLARVAGHQMVRFLTWRVRSFGRAFLACLVALASVSVFADVRETPHNLIKSRDKSVNEKQVCVFCHTPLVEFGGEADGMGTAGSAAKPLWQKSLGADFVFTIFDDIGRLGLGKPSVGSQSIACLSCHDSNQAFGVGRTSADHPFGIPYRGTAKYLAPTSQIVTPRADSGAPFRQAQHLTALEDFRDVSQGLIEGRPVFWVSRDGITSRRTRNDLPLYGRSDAATSFGAGVAVPHIECSSCHDPHASTETFLRVSTAGSQLCLTCHDK